MSTRRTLRALLLLAFGGLAFSGSPRASAQEITEVPVFVGGRSIVNYQSLARSYGLIPLPGPIRDAAPELDAQFQQWLSRNSPARGRTDEARSS